jgi:hypothetical protein
MGSNHRKRIAVVIPKYGLLGGAEGHTAELTNRLAFMSLPTNGRIILKISLFIKFP